MKLFLIVTMAALTAAQQIQEARVFSIPVRLASRGTFQTNNNGQGQRTSSQPGVAVLQTRNRFQANAVSNSNQRLQSAFQQSQRNSLASSSASQSQQNRFASTSFQTNAGNRLPSNFNQLNTGSSFQLSGNQRNTGINTLTTSNQGNTGSSFQTNLQGSTANSFSQTSQSSQGQSNRLSNFVSGSSSDASSAVANGVFEPLNLPSGASLLLGSISTSFSCVGRPYGYYADQDNSCRVFHICNPALFADGQIQTYQYSFMCGEETVFDQDEMTCKTTSSAIPCQQATEYFFRNEQFGRI